MCRYLTLLALVWAGALVSRAVQAQVGVSEEEEVTVRAAPLAPVIAGKDPSVAGSTLRRPELQAPGLSAADVLRTQVGVTLVETGALGAPATASVRGATAAETPVYVGGVRINDDVAGAADLSTIPLWLMDRVEVYRGNAPLEADRLTLGGAIFFEPLGPDRPRAGLGALAGSFGSRGLFAYSGSGNAEYGLLLGVRLEGADNDYPFYDTRGTELVPADDGWEKLENADVSLLDLWLMGSAAVGEGKVELLVNHFERDQGATSLAAVRTQAARQRLTRSLAAVTGSAPLGDSAWLELRTAGLVGGSLTTDPGLPPELLVGTNQLETRGERVEQQIATRFELGPHVLVRTGLEGASERLRRYEGAGADASPVLDERRFTGRAVVGAELDLTRWLSLRPLGSLECHATARGTDGACDALEPTGRLAALARTGELSLFGGVARYARVPTLGELYGMSPVVQGNPELTSETGVTFDAGARYSHRLERETSPLYLGLSGYFREARELVTFVRNTRREIVPKNLAEARVLGLEAEAGAGFLRYFAANLGCTLFDGRDQSPDRPLTNDILPYRSRLIASSALAATTPKLGKPWLDRAGLRVSILYQSNRYANPAGAGVIPEQSSLDLDGTLAALDGSVIFRARVADLLDTERFDIIGFPLPRRSVFFTLELKTPERD
jgi:vitamin B12 transporter